MLRMAIKYSPESQAGVRYLLMAYDRTGKTLSTAPFASLAELLEAFQTAGIFLERDEEESIIRDDASEQHYILVASKVVLRSSHCVALGLGAPEKSER